MIENCDTWAEKLQYEVYNYWKNNHSEWREGFQVFYSPADTSAPILILGINPGSSSGSNRFQEQDLPRFEDGDFSPPDYHYYLEHPTGVEKETVDLVGEAIVENSVKSNVNFFRSKKRSDLKEELGNFSQMNGWVLRILEKIDPEVIIAEGIGAYEIITNELLDTVDEERQIREINTNGNVKNYKITCVAKTREYTVVGFPHLTGRGSYVYDDLHKKMMAEKVKEVVESNAKLNIKK